MKLIFSLLVLAISGASVNAQNPVSWSFSSKKIDAKTFEIYLTATIQPGWHLYSQSQGDDAIAMPTDIRFNTNPLVVLDGAVKEMGTMERYEDKKLGLTANQYSEKVVFVQTVKLKGPAKTNISGTVEYQTCDDEKCLPPKKLNFSLALK